MTDAHFPVEERLSDCHKTSKKHTGKRGHFTSGAIIINIILAISNLSEQLSGYCSIDQARELPAFKWLGPFGEATPRQLGNIRGLSFNLDTRASERLANFRPQTRSQSNLSKRNGELLTRGVPSRPDNGEVDNTDVTKGDMVEMQTWPSQT